MTEKYSIDRFSESIVKVNLNGLSSLYSPNSQKFFQDLRGLLPETGATSSGFTPLKLLVLCQQKPLDDFDHDWYHQLKSDLFRQELQAYFQFAHSALADLRKAQLKIIYLSDSRCLGSFFELALACHVRIWFNKKPLIGFPEAEFGFFPGLHSLGMESKFVAEIKSHPKLPLVFKARDAYYSGLIHRAINNSKWHENLKDLLPDWLNSDFFTKLPEESTINSKAPRAYRYIKEKAMWRLNPDADEEVQHQRLRARYFSEYLNFWSKNKVLGEDTSVALELGAKQYFDHKYLRYLESASLKNPELASTTPIPILAIDVTHSTLPKGSLLRLIQSKKRLFLCCLEEDDLKKNLEVLYHRLAAVIKPEKLGSFWQNYVWWGHLGDESLKCPRLSWMAEQELKLTYNLRVFNFVHIYRDINSFRPSVYEWCCEGEDARFKEEILLIMACISKDVVMTRPLGRNKRSISGVIRTAFLGELISYCRQNHSSLEKLLGYLEKSGWAFASNSQQWEEFINYHGEELLPNSDQENTFFREFLGVNPNFFSIHRLMKELSRNASKSSFPQNAESVTVRMLIFCVLLLKKLVHLDTGLTLEQLDLLMSRCLGVPLSAGSPIDFARDINSSRLQAYVAKHWPHLLYLLRE